MWDNLPSGRRSDLMRQLLVDHELTVSSSEEVSDEWIMRKRLNELLALEMHAESRYSHWECVFSDLTGLVGDLEDEFLEKYPDSEYHKRLSNEEWEAVEKKNSDTMTSEMWDVIVSEAENFLQKGKVFHSPSEANRYRIVKVKNGKISGNLIDLESAKPSIFTQMTLAGAVNRLILSGGERIRANDFMASFAQSCAVVNLHPRLEFIEVDNQLLVVYTGVE